MLVMLEVVGVIGLPTVWWRVVAVLAEARLAFR